MDIVNPNIYLPSYYESEFINLKEMHENTNVKSKNKNKKNPPPKYTHSCIIEDNIVHPYIMQQPNSVVITIRQGETMTSYNARHSSNSRHITNSRRNQRRRLEDCCIFNICECYKRASYDSRCCGICYHSCPLKTSNENEQCQFCPVNIDSYIDSGYCKTTDLPGGPDDCLCTTFCCPIKFPMFFICFVGSIFNSYMNCCCSTHKNYLF